MTKKIDVYKIADEIYEKIDDTFRKELKESSENAKDSENPFAAKYVEDLEAVTRHAERFTVTLIQRVVDELTEDN